MTRINLGIRPRELCDQMLVAEYRELPRMMTFSEKRWAKYRGLGPRPEQFTLNAGHMSYFIPYGATMHDRWVSLCCELRKRGFACNNKVMLDYCWRGYRWQGRIHNTADIKCARKLLIIRIKERLLAMKRKPRWTNRTAPAWAS